MTERATTAKPNWHIRKARLAGVPGMPWMSFILTLGRRSQPLVSGGAPSKGCTDGWLMAEYLFFYAIRFDFV